MSAIPRRERLRIVRNWLTKLAVRMAAAEPTKELQQRIEDYSKTLVDNFQSDESFSDASLEFIASRFKFFPSFAELHPALAAHWDTIKPKPPAKRSIAAGLMGEPARWFDYFHTRRDEIGRGLTSPKAGDAAFGSRDAALASLASLVRQESPEAWAALRAGDDGHAG